ncbi:MAG TPA: 2-oxo acid dehydrogenase subunit E2, partial [Opitutaceae bacterium]|nr:2-oxo acid dehydrogenase subunit E2 [Opitutaceae bacterium]
RRLESVVPANIQMSIKWQAVRAARTLAKQNAGDEAVSPSLMVAWAVARAMEKHASFRSLVTKDGSIIQHDDFDLGFAVALEEDRLATAVIHQANRLAWPDFCRAYGTALAAARAGKIEDVQAPLNITSLGSFGVESAIPIVVPPAMSTLFIGTAHQQMINDGGVIYPVEAVQASLTFDHKVVNGAGAAAFLQEVKTQLEKFVLAE